MKHTTVTLDQIYYMLCRRDFESWYNNGNFDIHISGSASGKNITKDQIIADLAKMVRPDSRRERDRKETQDLIADFKAKLAELCKPYQEFVVEFKISRRDFSAGGEYFIYLSPKPTDLNRNLTKKEMWKRDKLTTELAEFVNGWRNDNQLTLAEFCLMVKIHFPEYFVETW